MPANPFRDEAVKDGWMEEMLMNKYCDTDLRVEIK